ncbi:MAG: hypothetical protein QM831_04010 [Kofleriaceae bacterium]
MGKLFVALFAMSSLVGCAHHGGDDDDDGSGTYSSVRLSPDPVTLSVALGATASQDYMVLGTDSSGEHEITDQCAISVDPSFGTSAGKTVTVGGKGGATQVTAICGTATGAAVLNINLTGSQVGGSAPANSDQIFGSATVDTATPANNPAIEYPIDQAVAPLNIPSIQFQWTKPAGDLFHLHLASTYASIDAYTTDPQNAFSEADWIAIANTAVGDKLAVTVEALAQANPSTKWSSTAVTLNLSHDTIDTSAIYWWASSQQQIVTQTFGQTAAPTQVKGNCSGCHSLSRSGSRIAYSRCVNGDCNSNEGFLKYNSTTMQWDEVVNADARAISGTYATFAPVGNPFPDDTQSVALVTSMTGNFSLYDPDTGAAIASNVTAVTQAGRVTMPDWSPDGTNVVFTQADALGGDSVDVTNGAIYKMPYAYTGGAHTFSTPTPLVQGPLTVNGMQYTNLFFPSYSPDGQLVVFDAARSRWRDNSAGHATLPGQRLMMVNAAGGTPVDLYNLNGDAGDHNITWAHWAPGATTDYYWIVFSSERDYGHLSTKTTAVGSGCIQNGVLQCKQIWIAAVSKASLMNGTLDPSSPPMWLPGQDVKADNISPYWTVPAGLF